MNMIFLVGKYYGGIDLVYLLGQALCELSGDILVLPESVPLCFVYEGLGDCSSFSDMIYELIDLINSDWACS